jgi:hypothetical protein
VPAYVRVRAGQQWFGVYTLRQQHSSTSKPKRKALAAAPLYFKNFILDSLAMHFTLKARNDM